MVVSRLDHLDLAVHLRDRAPSVGAPRTHLREEMSLTRAFPKAGIARAAGVGNQVGQVTPSGLLPDGVVYGVVKRPAGTAYVTTAVTIDLRIGRQTVIEESPRGSAPPQHVAFSVRMSHWLTASGAAGRSRPTRSDERQA
jgi:hypothetical protein